MQGGLLLLQTKQSKIKLTQNTQKPQTIPVNSRMVARGGAAPRPAKSLLQAKGRTNGKIRAVTATWPFLVTRGGAAR